jgi:hypothetical protein
MKPSTQRFWGLLTLLVVSPVWASTLVKTNLDTLSASSDVVVRGKVKKMQSRWAKSGGRIVTEIEVEVTEALKGQPAKIIVIRQPGGVVGDIGQKVLGLASFEQGEDVVVFLAQRPGNAFDVNGSAQGKFRLKSSEDGKKLLAVPDGLEGTRLVDPVTHQPVAPETEPIALETLRAKIKEANKTAAGRSPRKNTP